MKKVFKALKFTGFLAFISLVIIACDQDFNSIDSDVIGLKSFNTNHSQVPIVSYNKKLDSLRINNLSASLLGVFNDPSFGQTTASIITQITPTSFDPSFGDNPAIDSVILTIPYFSKILADTLDIKGNSVYSIKDSLFGNASIKLSIYRNNYFLRNFNPAAGLDVSQMYFSHASNASTDNFALTEAGPIDFDSHKGELVYENDDFTPSSDAIPIKKVSTDGTETTERIAPALRDTLNRAFWKSAILDKEGDAVLSNVNNFYDYFRGLYFKAEANGGNGNMILFNIAGSGANITIYYSYDSTVEDADRLTSTYVLNFSSGNRVNTFINNYNMVSLTNGDPINGDEKLYLKGTEGSMAVVDLFIGNVDYNGETMSALEAFKKTYRAEDENGDYIMKNGSYVLKKLINEAQLVVYEDESLDSIFHKYDRLYAYDIKNNIPLIDYSYDPSGSTADPYNSKFIHLGQRKTDDNGISKYKIRITEHLNNILLKDSTNTKIGLVLSTNVNNTESASILNSNDIVTGVPATSIITPRGTILYGSNENVPEDKRMSLELYFTESTENQ